MQIELIPLFSGSTGNALLVRAGALRVLVDAGVSARAVADALLCAGCPAETLDAILVTHEHADHIRGLPVLAKKTGVPVYASAGTWREMKSKFRDFSAIRDVTLPGGDFYIGGLGVCPFPLSHDAAEPVGYAFYMGGEKAAVATDTGYMSPNMLRTLSGAESVVLEFNHDVTMLKNGPYPNVLKRRVLSRTGHLSNEAAARALADLAVSGTRVAHLAHISRTNNAPELAEAAARAALEAAGFYADDVAFSAAPPARYAGPAPEEPAQRAR